MDKILYASVALAVLLLAGTIFLSIKKRPEGLSDVCVREDWMTAVMGAMVIVLSFWFAIMKIQDPALSGSDATSYWYIALFCVVGNLAGDFMLLYSFVKRVELYEDRVESVSAFGKVTTLGWGQIIQVKKPMMGRSTKLVSSDGTVISVSGAPKACDAFVDYARPRINSSQSGNLLKHVENRLKIK